MGGRRQVRAKDKAIGLKEGIKIKRQDSWRDAWGPSVSVDYEQLGHVLRKVNYECFSKWLTCQASGAAAR